MSAAVVVIAGHRVEGGSRAEYLLQQAVDMDGPDPVWKRYAEHCVSDAKHSPGYIGPVEQEVKS